MPDKYKLPVDEMITTTRLSGRVWRLAAGDGEGLAHRLRYTIPRLVEFLETHHDDEERERDGECRACVLINHIELELGRE